MSIRSTMIAVAAASFGLAASEPVRAAPVVKPATVQRSEAGHAHGVIRRDHAMLFRAPLTSFGLSGCEWLRVPTADGDRFRPICESDPE